MLFRRQVSQSIREPYLDGIIARRGSAIVPWVFALGGTGLMLMGAFGGSMSSETNQLLMLGGSACEALGIARLLPRAFGRL
jgi:hypothetical protein